jgi:hypothetical protein
VAGRRPELSGGHTVAQTIGFVNALADVADAQAQRRASPVVFVLAAGKPRWLTTVRRWFGH